MTNPVLILLDESQVNDEFLETNDSAVVIPRSELVDMCSQQMEAISSLLLAFDLPAEMGKVANNMVIGAFVNPDAKIGQMGSDNRKHQLEKAKSLVEQMLADIQ
jgi:hypothetical protein